MTTHPDPWDELDEHLAGPEPDWESPPESPPDARVADALIARLARLRRERDRSREAAEARIGQIVEWQAEREGEYLRQEEWLERSLAAYHAHVLELDPNRKTVRLPSGDLMSRKGQPFWAVDEDAVLEALLPPPLRERLDALREAWLSGVSDLLVGNLGVLAPAVRLTPPGPVELSLSGLKKATTARNAKGEPTARGVRPDGSPMPGVAVAPAERTYDVAPRFEPEPPEYVIEPESDAKPESEVEALKLLRTAVDSILTDDEEDPW